MDLQIFDGSRSKGGSDDDDDRPARGPILKPDATFLTEGDDGGGKWRMWPRRKSSWKSSCSTRRLNPRNRPPRFHSFLSGHVTSDLQILGGLRYSCRFIYGKEFRISGGGKKRFDELWTVKMVILSIRSWLDRFSRRSSIFQGWENSIRYLWNLNSSGISFSSIRFFLLRSIKLFWIFFY